MVTDGRLVVWWKPRRLSFVAPLLAYCNAVGKNTPFILGNFNVMRHKQFDIAKQAHLELDSRSQFVH